MLQVFLWMLLFKELIDCLFLLLITLMALIELNMAQISKIIQSGGFLGSLLSKLAGLLMKVADPLAQKVLAPLKLTAVMCAIDAGIQKNTWFWINNFNNFK